MNDREQHPEVQRDDPSIAAIDAALRSLADATDLRPTFLDAYLPRFRREALHARTAAAPIALRPRVTRRRWHTFLGLATAAALVLALVGGAFWWAGKPASVSAQEVAARAEQAASGGVPSLHSYSYTITSHFPAPGPQGGTSDVEYRSWYEAPDRLRMESYVKSSVAPDEPNVINIQDGAVRWEYLPSQRRATRKAPTPVAATFGNARDVQTLLASVADRNKDVQLRGTTTIAGREAYVLAVTPNPSPGSVFPPGSTTTLYIDKETYVSLGSETRDARGTLVGSSTISNLQINRPMDASRFTLTPPAGAEVVDDTHQAVPDAATYIRQLGDASARAEFTLLVPTNVPAGLAPRAPLADTGLVALAYAPAGGAGADYSHDAPPLTLTERKTMREDAEMPPGAEQATVPGSDAAWFLPQAKMPTGFTVGPRLVVMRGGTTMTLAATRAAFSKEQLVQIAASLQPIAKAAGVSAAPTATPAVAPQNAPLSGPALLTALRQGGYVIFFRNVQTNDETLETSLNNPNGSCSPQRNLTDQGRAAARAIGDAFRALHIPVLQVLTNYRCAAIVTATTAFGEVAPRDELIEPTDPSDTAGRARTAQAVRTALGKPPSPGTNMIVIGQQSLLTDAVGPDVTLAEGEAAIFAPDGTGGFTLVARLLPEQWASMSPGA